MKEGRINLMHQTINFRRLQQFLFAALLLISLPGQAADESLVSSEKHDFSLQIVTDELENPWGMAFLPDGDILVTERRGELRRIHAGQLVKKPIQGLPNITAKGQGGLLDVVLHPDFEKNQLVYISYVGKKGGGLGTEVARGRLDGMQLRDVKVIFQALPKSYGGHHFGSRLVFDGAGHLFISLGDRGDKDRAQDLSDHAGSLIRINEDGTVPSDNPFTDNPQAGPEIFTLGNRNMQGLAMNPLTREVWAHEHGPQGGDEINIMRAGLNYGWPEITYGVNYVLGTKIGEGTAKEGMQQPIHYWIPSIAPSGMTFYNGKEFPAWENNLFVGSLKFGQLVRLEIKDDQVVHEERMLDDRIGRIRDVKQGLDGSLYLLTDERRGKLVRLEKAK